MAGMIKVMAPETKYIVVTSETKSIVQNFTNHSEIGFKYVQNVMDTMPGHGSGLYQASQNPFAEFVSQMSSMRLHFASKYIVASTYSNWIDRIHRMSLFSACDPIHGVRLASVDEPEQKQECIKVASPQKDNYIGRIAIMSHNLLQKYQINWINATHPHNITVDLKKECESTSFM